MAVVRRHGFILITALWTLTFLSVLAVMLLAGVRQRIVLFQRLEDRARVQAAAEAGVKKAEAMTLDALEDPSVAAVVVKQRLHNNPAEFAGMDVGGVAVEVVPDALDPGTGAVGTAWGVADEQSKINLNTSSREILARLVTEALGWNGVEARALADAIADWRDYGQHSTEGFFNDDYYKSLEFPYPMKDAVFARPDELLLVKGVNAKIYETLLPFITVYGDGHVNINTASRQALVALGLDVPLAQKLVRFRRGADNLEATADDHVFARTFDVAADIAGSVKLDPSEVRQIDDLNARDLLTSESGIYAFISRVPASAGGYKRSIACVFSVFESRVLYWYEK